MQYTFDLKISREEMLKFYAGAARAVHARDRHGAIVSFPAQVLRPYVGANGVQGTFRLTVDRSHRLSRVERLA